MQYMMRICNSVSWIAMYKLTFLAGKKLYQNSGSINPIYQPLSSGRIWHKVNF